MTTWTILNSWELIMECELNELEQRQVTIQMLLKPEDSFE
jgi:hypothetical protein